VEKIEKKDGRNRCLEATRPGFEPGIREPKSRVLPITPPGNHEVEAKFREGGACISKKSLSRVFPQGNTVQSGWLTVKPSLIHTTFSRFNFCIFLNKGQLWVSG
jgi:hypothetical protein